jgi:hypothetical protein
MATTNLAETVVTSLVVGGGISLGIILGVLAASNDTLEAVPKTENRIVTNNPVRYELGFECCNPDITESSSQPILYIRMQ